MEGEENKREEQGENQEVSEESQQEQAPQAETFPGKKIDKQAVVNCAQDLWTRVQKILTNPDEAWDQIKATDSSIQEIYTQYVAIMAAISIALSINSSGG